MKKLFIIAAAACVTLASCVKNEPNASVASAGDELVFDSPVLALNTKAATEIQGDFPTDKNLQFHVNAYLTENNTFAVGSDYMTADGETISYNGGAWRAATKYYWPKSGYLHFLAYYPEGATGASIGATGVKFTGYTVPAAASTDLLYSDLATSQGKEPVQLSFNHALSAIDFTVTKGNVTPVFVIKNITIKGIKTTGNFDQNLNGVAAWSDPNPASATTNYVAYDKGEGTGLTLDATIKYVHSGNTDKDGQAALILLPQDVTGKKVVVTFTMDNFPQEVEFTLDGEWEMGTRYTYAISFGADEITFTPEAKNWTPETGAFANN